MLSGFEYELANEIHQARLHRAERSRLRTLVKENGPSRRKKWAAHLRRGARRLHLFWGGVGPMSTDGVTR